MSKIPKKRPIKKAKKLVAPSIYSLGFPKDYSLQMEGTSQSLLQDFLKCRYCYIISLNKYEPVGTYNTTGFGSITHDILDKMYSFNKDCERIPEDTVISNWVDNFPKENPDDVENMSQQDIEFMQGVVYVLMTEYKKYYVDDFSKVQFIELEKESETIWDGYVLRRKIDAKFRIRGNKWLLEHKTKGWISEKNLLLQLSFDFQNLFYIVCEEMDIPDDPIEGIVYNVIRRPAHMQKEGEDLKDFLERLRSEVKKNPAHFFKRYEIQYLQEDKLRFRQELKGVLWEADACIKGDLPLFKNTTACVSWYTCENLPACASGKLSGYIKKKYWFPELSIGI